MTALVQTLSRLSAADGEGEAFKVVILFCCTGLLVSLLLATFGLDLGTASFD